MSRDCDAWAEAQRRRFMRPDAHRYVRPDAWRFMAPGAPRLLGKEAVGYFWPDTKAARPTLSRKYNPDQPRVPAGNPDGGQWTIDGGWGAAQSDSFNPLAALAEIGVRLAADGHHYVPRGVFENEKYSFQPETLKVLEGAKTGPLNDPTSNRFDELHRHYNKAVEGALDRFLDRNNIRSEQMTADHARRFADEIKTSKDPTIRQFNMRLWMRELNYWIRRGPRGRE